MGRCDMVSLSQRDRTSHVMSAHSSHEARAILQRYVNETRGGHPFNNDLSKLTQRREEACDCSREPACTVRESTSQSDPYKRDTQETKTWVSQFNARRAFFFEKGNQRRSWFALRSLAICMKVSMRLRSRERRYHRSRPGRREWCQMCLLCCT